MFVAPLVVIPGGPPPFEDPGSNPLRLVNRVLVPLSVAVVYCC